MRAGLFLSVIFHAAVAACLWPLYVHATAVVGWMQTTFHMDRTFQMPTLLVLAHALQASLIMWAIGAGLVLFRKGQGATAWLIVLLALAPTVAKLAGAA